MRLPSLLALLGLTALLSAQAQTTGPDGDADAAARRALYAQCGAVEATALPQGVTVGVYRGTLGTQRVTLELTRDGGEQQSEHPDRYSYDRYGLDIALTRGRPTNRTAVYALAAVEAVFTGDGQVARGCLDLSADGTGLRGQWRSPDGRTRLHVTLNRVDAARVPLALPSSPGLLNLRSSDPYTFLKLDRPWQKVTGGLKEPLTGVTYPRVQGGSAALNAALQDLQLKLVTSAFDCRGGYGTNLENGTDFTGSGTLSWQSASLVSLHEDAQYFCGGAHPDAYTSGVTLSARTGRPVPLAAQPGAVWPALNAPKLQALYLAAYPSGGDTADCRDLLASAEGRAGDPLPYELYLTRAGLAVWPNFLPHVALACAEVVTVPYAKLRALANSAGASFRDLYPR